MLNAINIGLISVIAYLLGSLTFGMLVPKLMGSTSDVRKEGSGSVGATNVFRTRGMLQGALVLVGDVLKGALAAKIGIVLGGVTGGSLAGVCAMLGHCFPLYFGFKGGKAVATGAGIVLVLFPKALLFMVPLFLLTIAFTKIVSLGSILGVLMLDLCIWLYHPPLSVAVFCVVAAFLIIWKHKDNIRRLLSGTENRIGKRV